MTANPNWPEIHDNLRQGECAYNRPDLTARVFRHKLKALLQDVVRDGVLGRVVAWTYAVEFQKRGLPHAHILLVLHPEDKLRTPKDIDAVVSAEIPDPALDPLLYEKVTTHMLHGPCGTKNPHCVCMSAGTCKKGYPKALQEATVANSNGYPMYRRRANGPVHEEQDCTWVVPHNPWLLCRYGCFDGHLAFSKSQLVIVTVPQERLYIRIRLP